MVPCLGSDGELMRLLPVQRGELEACTHLSREAGVGGRALKASELTGGCLNEHHFWRETRPAKRYRSSFSEHETKLSQLFCPKTYFTHG